MLQNLAWDELRQACIENNWFTCGTTEQYTKLYERNRDGADTTELATIIWVCTNDKWTKEEIHEGVRKLMLQKSLYGYVKDHTVQHAHA